MRIDFIIKKFRKSGYNITRDVNTSVIVVTTPRGFGHTFESYRAAYLYYFPKNEEYAVSYN